MYIKVSSPNEAVKLSNLLKDGDWMVLYYADWCGHCQTMKPEWRKVIENMKKTNIVNLAEIESNHIGSLINKPEVNGFPTIKMYNQGIEKANFEDDRIADKMTQFAFSNVTKTTKPIKSTKHSRPCRQIQHTKLSVPIHTTKHKPLSINKKTSHKYINPMKHIVKSILSRRTKNLKTKPKTYSVKSKSKPTRRSVNSKSKPTRRSVKSKSKPTRRSVKSKTQHKKKNIS